MGARERETKGRINRDFNHKAVHAMAEAGESITEIAEVLELSKRTVYMYLAAPCLALDAQREEAARLAKQAVARR
ncbi:helix-turn-helix domain-containing protein, partial [Rhizobium leguminosarum]|uniref:helix-turn-helix domain-containing protein n=1 Tax=Rhizobium leguminosarum TaxID=384 RepID=UPI003F9CB75D